MKDAVPLDHSLFKSIDRLEEELDKLSQALIARGLLYKDLLDLVQLSVEVCCIEVESFQLLTKVSCKGHQHLEASKARDW